MADIFISYSQKDPEPTKELAAELESRGYSVWWDTSLLAGAKFREVILCELAAAKAVIVIWTPNSVKSDWVIDEADRARVARKLVPLRLPEVDIQDVPPPFGALHTEVIGDVGRLVRALVAMGVARSEPSIQPPIGSAQYVDCGNAFLGTKEFDRAIAEYTKAITLNPQNSEAYNCRGLAFIDKGEYDRAIDDFNAAIERYSNDTFAYKYRGIAHEKKGDRRRAIADFRQAYSFRREEWVLGDLERLGAKIPEEDPDPL
jgi:tetratricopeptide (TPR) repeat protein